MLTKRIILNFSVILLRRVLDDAEEESDQTQMKEEGLWDDFVEEDAEEENDQEQLKGFGMGLEKNEGENGH